MVLSVRGVALDDETGAPSVILRDAYSEQVISVPVGNFEASSIIIEVEGIKPPRPLTHDLFTEMFKKHGYKLISFDMYARTEEGFLGRIIYRNFFKTWTMEVRPSDGIALALRLEAPIRMDKDLFETLISSKGPFHTAGFNGDILFLGARNYEEQV